MRVVFFMKMVRNILSHERFHTKSRFDTETQGNSEMPSFFFEIQETGERINLLAFAEKTFL